MPRKSRRRKPSYRPRSPVSGWWRDIRFYWYTTNKGALTFPAIAALIVGGFGFLMYSVFTDKADRQNLTCLAQNVYFEARGEPRAGQYAVAEVTMNRVASGRYPDTVCDVVYEQRWDPLRKRYVGAFSWTELDEKPALTSKEWRDAWDVAEAVYRRRHEPQVEGALLYHAVYIRPSWSRNRKPVARIGKHLFYK
jgi:spore germination cell wall hydrolase CwlJ-like protein